MDEKQLKDQQEKHLKDKCLKLLQTYTKHPVVKITNSGNAAIFGALSIAKQRGCKEVLIPDQGGWLSYKTFPKLLDLKITELKTTYGLISTNELQKHKNAALLFSSFAGYAAPQDIEAIAQVCKENNILIIEDASGSLTHSILCNGNLSDIIVASFGKWKIADVGHGGFLSAKEGIITKEIKESDILSLISINIIDYAILLEKIKAAPQRLQFILKKTKEIKALCKQEHFEMIHEDAEGLSIFVTYKTDKEKEHIIEFCKKQKLEYKECPLYIKVLEKAISIEVKRLTE